MRSLLYFKENSLLNFKRTCRWRKHYFPTNSVHRGVWGQVHGDSAMLSEKQDPHCRSESGENALACVHFVALWKCCIKVAHWSEGLTPWWEINHIQSQYTKLKISTKHFVVFLSYKVLNLAKSSSFAVCITQRKYKQILLWTLDKLRDSLNQCPTSECWTSHSMVLFSAMILFSPFCHIQCPLHLMTFSHRTKNDIQGQSGSFSSMEDRGSLSVALF